jgi:hypothetical protein
MKQEDLQEFRDKIPYLRSKGSEAALLAADLFESLVDHIDEQANQIGILKEKLTAERAFQLPEDTDQEAREIAIKQLKAEVKEVNWE